jgi:hypothetical protein
VAADDRESSVTIPDELRDNAKLMRLRRLIAVAVIRQQGRTEEAEGLMRWIDQAIATGRARSGGGARRARGARSNFNPDTEPSKEQTT